MKEQPQCINHKDFKGIVDASGEAKWTVEAALAEDVPRASNCTIIWERNASKLE